MGTKTFPKLALVGRYFPDFDAWLRKSSSRDKYMEVAEETLDAASPSAIEKACERLLRDDPVRTQRLPFVIAEIASRIDAFRSQRALEREAGVGLRRCKYCPGDGIVEILDPNTVAYVLRTRKLPAFPYRIGAVCVCEAGRAILERNNLAEPRFKRPLVQFDPAKHHRRENGILPLDQYRQLLEQIPHTENYLCPR